MPSLFVMLKVWMKLNFHFLFPRKESKGIEDGRVWMLESENPEDTNLCEGPAHATERERGKSWPKPCEVWCTPAGGLLQSDVEVKPKV